jgi:hypothetical protein
MARNHYAKLHGLRVDLSGDTGALADRCGKDAPCRNQTDQPERIGLVHAGKGKHPGSIVCASCGRHLSWIGHQQLKAIAAANSVTLPETGDVTCPTCHKPAPHVVCGGEVQHACCGLWSTGGRPLETSETWAARRNALGAFQRLIEREALSRDAAYQHLAAQMGINRKEAIISAMDEGRAVRALDAIAAIRQRLGSMVKPGEVIDHG